MECIKGKDRNKSGLFCHAKTCIAGWFTAIYITGVMIKRPDLTDLPARAWTVQPVPEYCSCCN